MKALRLKISTYAVALLMAIGLSTTSHAGSSDFAGIYGAFNASAGGAAINGTHTNQSSEITEGQLGGVFPLAGYEVGFTLPVGDVFFIGVGHSWTKGGSASIVDGEGGDKGGANNSDNSENDGASSTNIHLKAKNLKEVYITPGISITDGSAMYVKIGRSIADTEISGNVTGTTGNLQGRVLGIGTIAMMSNGLFIKTEGSVTRFDKLSLTGVGGSAGAKVEGTPDMVAGSIAIGFKF